MTTKDYCKPLAELDNSLKYREQCDNTEALLNSELSKPSLRGTFTFMSDEVSEDFLSANSGLNPSLQNPFSTPGIIVDEPDGSLRYQGSVKHIYPNGWIPVIESSKVRAGTVRRAMLMGRDIIVARSADGLQVNVLDAYCPHMGVHLGIAGRVVEVEEESCIECPFHGWTFRSSDGNCVKIPYQKNPSVKTIPKQAKIGSWVTEEKDNFIYVWHHVDNVAPTWHIEPCIELSKWSLAGRSCHRANLDIRDMHENGADMNHFEGIHNDLVLLGSHISKIMPLKYLQQYVRHHWQSSWEPVLDEKGRMSHKAHMKLTSCTSLFKFKFFEVTVHAYQVGPARVNLYYNSAMYGRGLLIMNAIPLGGRRTKYIQHIYVNASIISFLKAKVVLYGEVKQLERDFFMWNHKKTIKSPIFVAEDKTVKQFRMWYSQFYRRKRTIVADISVKAGISGPPNKSPKSFKFW